jgi:glutamine cyclotransferase
VNLQEIGRVDVYDEAGPVTQLNELEYIDGQVWANVWYSDRIARIDPQSGRVTGWVDLTGILPASQQTARGAVLNGIAYDAVGDRIFVTGKLWPTLFEIEVVPAAQVKEDQ